MQNYQFIKKIGKGQFSEVSLVSDEKKNKFIIKKFSDESAIQARKEFYFLSAVEDEYIPKPIYFDEEKATLCLPYIEGKNLKEYVFGKGESKEKLILKILSILMKVHNAGICLNDIKPENIIINNKKPYLIDFDLATINLFNDSRFRGTFAYSAPEKILHSTNHFASDVFSVGMLYYFLLFGKSIADDFSKDQYDEIVRSKKKWNHHIKFLASKNSLLSKMLEYDPGVRILLFDALKDLSNKLKIKIPDLGEYYIKNLVFSTQVKFISKLKKKKLLKIEFLDEIERIINLFSLSSESGGKKILVIRDSDLLKNPSKFISNLKLALKSNDLHSSLVKYLKNFPDINFLIIANCLNKSIFSEIENLQNVYILLMSEESDVEYIQKSEIESIVNQLSIAPNKSLINSELGYKSYILRNELLKMKFSRDENQKTNKLVDFLSIFDFPIKIEYLSRIFPEWNELLREGILRNSIVFKGEEIQAFNLTQQNIRIDVKFLENALMIASQDNYYIISAHLSILLKKTDQALDFYLKQTDRYIKSGFFISALAVIEKAKTILNLGTQNIKFLKKEASIKQRCGMYKEALSIYEYMENIAEETEIGSVYNDKALVLQAIDKKDEACVMFKKAAKIFLKNNQIVPYFRCQNNLGAVLCTTNEFKSAENIFLDILGKAKEVSNPQFVTLSYLNLSEIYLRIGEWKKSLHFATKAAEIGEKHKKKQIKLQAEISAIKANFALGKYENLLDTLEVLTLYKEIQENQELYFEVLSTYCFISLITNKDIPEKISDGFDQIIATSKNDEYLYSLFFVYLREGKYKSAMKLHEINKMNLMEVFLDYNEKEIVDNLELLTLSNDIYKLFFFASLIVVNIDLGKNLLLKKELNKILQIYKYEPLTHYLAKRNDSSQEFMPLIWDVINMIHANVEFENTLHAVFEGVLKIGKLERVIYFEFDNGGLIPVAGIDFSGRKINLDNVRVSKSILKDTIMMGSIRFLTNLQEDIPNDIHSSIFGLGLRTAVCSPLIINNEIMGIIYSDTVSENQFTIDEKRILEILFNQATSALRRSQIFDEMKRKNLNRQSTITEVKYSEIIGQSKKMQDIFSLMKMVSKHNVNVLIIGPTGSGKELIAKALHSDYAKNKPYVAVNCAAIPENLLESELFGYSKGAFTGADSSKKGKIELANQGTLFLDEIGEMSVSLQAKLLRVIQERLVSPVGSEKEIPVSIRIVAATNQNLEQLVKENRFRSDLYYRLKVINIKIPPLGERRSDIPLLADFFIKRYSQKFKKSVNGISANAMNFLQNKQWEGNVRELENTIERGVLLTQKDIVDIDCFEFNVETNQKSIFEDIPLSWSDYKCYKSELIDKLDQKYLDSLLNQCKGSVRVASEMGNLTRKQVYRLIEKSNKTKSVKLDKG